MPDRTDKQIGDRLREIRGQKHLTQAGVAKLVGTKENYYAKVERGGSTPSLKMLRKIVKALGVNFKDIV